ncbi:hypothetical protein [Halpernia sp.]|uniref:hypothetical protein n=1 Tax=Halpernia sp. TaxID=2782209 RepID=UPI003A8D3A80
MKNFTIKILILTLTFFVLSNVIGQTISYPPNFKFKSETFKSESLGVANQNFYYKISFVKNPKVPDNKTVAIGILQIGENYSKFIDVIQLQRDSVIEKQSHQSTINADEFDVLLKLKTQWETIVVKDFKDKNIFIQDWARKTYQYEIQNPVFNWKLKEGKKIF